MHEGSILLLASHNTSGHVSFLRGSLPAQPTPGYVIAASVLPAQPTPGYIIAASVSLDFG